MAAFDPVRCVRDPLNKQPSIVPDDGVRIEYQIVPGLLVLAVQKWRGKNMGHLPSKMPSGAAF